MTSCQTPSCTVSSPRRPQASDIIPAALTTGYSALHFLSSPQEGSSGHLSQSLPERWFLKMSALEGIWRLTVHGPQQTPVCQSPVCQSPALNEGPRAQVEVEEARGRRAATRVAPRGGCRVCLSTISRPRPQTSSQLRLPTPLAQARSPQLYPLDGGQGEKWDTKQV